MAARAGQSQGNLETTAAHAAVYVCRLSRALREEGAKEMPMREAS